jgi:hypothetical protein
VVVDDNHIERHNHVEVHTWDHNRVNEEEDSILFDIVGKVT